MSTVTIDCLLVIVVLATWLGCAGFARLRTPLDRMHSVAFVNATAWVALTVAAFVSDGFSSRALKILAITIVNLVAGGAMSHATGRAVLLRDGAPANAPEPSA